MSAFVCSDKHILTVAAIIAHVVGDKTVDDIFEIARELRRENIRSVNYRYSERSRFPKNWDCSITSLNISNLSNVDRAALVDCLDYQSSERPDYYKSHAGRMLTRAIAYYDSVNPTWAKSNLWSI